MIYGLCYISKKSADLKKDDVQNIVLNSQENNALNEITGVLIAYKSHFLQYIEGDSVEIYALYNKIKEDKRHLAVQLLQYSPIESMLFSGWSMAFKQLSKSTKVDLPKSEAECINGIEQVVSHKAFWKGIETIEVMSNLMKG